MRARSSRYGLGFLLPCLGILSGLVQPTFGSGVSLPERVRVLAALRVAKQEGKPEEVERIFQTLIEKNPTDAFALQGLAGVSVSLGKFGQAKSLYARLLQIPEEASDAHYNLARLAEFEGQREAALTHWRAVVESRPDYPAARFELARLAQVMGRESEARRHWKAAADLVPEDPAPRKALAQLQLRRGAWKDARERFEEALHLDPEDCEIRAALRKVLLQIGPQDRLKWLDSLPGECPLGRVGLEGGAPRLLPAPASPPEGLDGRGLFDSGGPR